jgi:hypothetical protein
VRNSSGSGDSNGSAVPVEDPVVVNVAAAAFFERYAFPRSVGILTENYAKSESLSERNRCDNRQNGALLCKRAQLFLLGTGSQKLDVDNGYRVNREGERMKNKWQFPLNIGFVLIENQQPRLT